MGHSVENPEGFIPWHIYVTITAALEVTVRKQYHRVHNKMSTRG